MMVYQVGGKTFRPDHTDFEAALAAVYRGKDRPRCLCRQTGIEMYVARVQGKHILKRMPNTGSDHNPGCESYEPPAELSGLGEVMGAAIHEDPEQNVTALKLDFSLSKQPGRAAPTPGTGEADSVRTDGAKLTLRGTLHYLWEQAGFNRWSPAMTGKRSWGVIRKYLLQAASDKTAKGVGLSDLLYIPEAFFPERQSEIAQRRIAKVMKVTGASNGAGKAAQKLMMVIGEVREIAPSRYGHKVVFKHLPDWHFMLAEDLHKRLRKRFATELDLWDAVDGSHLVLFGTFGVGGTGIPSLNELALMTTTDSWLPFENLYEQMLLDALAKGRRRFLKGLRYNLPSSRPLASAVLTDTQPGPTALYIIPPGASEDFASAVEQLTAESKLASWTWPAGAGTMPALPAADSQAGKAS